METKLDIARKIINEADKKMAEAFIERMRASEMVAEYKTEHGLQIFDASREKEVIEKNSKFVEDDILREYYIDFIKHNMDISKEYQRRIISGMKISFSGIEGAYAYFAAKNAFPDAEKVPCPSFEEAYRMTESGKADAAVLPIENSIEGEVGQVCDLMFQGSLFVNGIIEMPISHFLLAKKGARMENIKKVISHPQALGQCRKFIEKTGFETINCANTAIAAKTVAESDDPSIAAIASAENAEIEELSILASAINDRSDNTTRFAILSRSENRSISKKNGAHFILMFTVLNEAGALAKALQAIGKYGFNMRSLRSRGLKDTLWQYYFYAEAMGDIYSENGIKMLEEMKKSCDNIKILGSFIPFKEN